MPPGPSQSIDLGVGPTRRRSLKVENAGPLSKHSTVPNEDSVLSTEDVEPDPGGFDDDDKDLEVKGRPDATKLKSLRKRKVPPNVNFEPPDESSSEDEKPMRYILCLFSILSFNFLFIYLYFCKSVKEDESL